MLNIIAAIGQNRELGKKNGLLWHLHQDITRFKTLTMGHPVIMGRKTFESIPEKFRPLPGRTNIVITKGETFSMWRLGIVSEGANRESFPEVIIKNSLESAIEEARKIDSEIFIIGGGQIYDQAINIADRLYLTLIHKSFPEADVYFPDYSNFKEIWREDHLGEELPYSFVELIR